jgi:hypothetical protein
MEGLTKEEFQVLIDSVLSAATEYRGKAEIEVLIENLRVSADIFYAAKEMLPSPENSVTLCRLSKIGTT